MKRKTTTKVLSGILSAILAFSSPIATFADTVSDNSVPDEMINEQTDPETHEENTDAEEIAIPISQGDENALTFALQEEFDLFSYDWKNADDEELNRHLLSANPADAKAFVCSLSEEDLDLLFSKARCMNVPYSTSSEEDCFTYDNFYDYLMQLDDTTLKSYYDTTPTQYANGWMMVNLPITNSSGGITDTPSDVNIQFHFDNAAADTSQSYQYTISCSGYLSSAFNVYGGRTYKYSTSTDYNCTFIEFVPKTAFFYSDYTYTAVKASNAATSWDLFPNARTESNNIVTSGSMNNRNVSTNSFYFVGSLQNFRGLMKDSNTNPAAFYIVENYTITYNSVPNFATFTNKITSYNHHSSAVTLKKPTFPTGYTFTGWTGSNGATPQTTVTIPAGSRGNKTYACQYTTINYQLTYNLQGGYISGNNGVDPYVTYYTVESAFTLPKPLRLGYTFKGWTGANGTTPQITVNIAQGSTGAKTYTANWTPITYTIVYDKNGGTGTNMSNSSHTYDTPKALNKNTYTRQGYEFKGFSASQTGSTTIHQDQETVKNLGYEAGQTVTLYAQWEPHTYYINYDGRGSTSGSMSKSTLIYDTPSNLRANGFQKIGYDFAGWSDNSLVYTVKYTNKQSVKNLTTTKNGNVYLYACWDPHVYTIVYYGNGSTSGSTSSSTHTYDTSKELTANGFVRNYYDFKGWSTSNTATTATYTDKQSVKNLTTGTGTVGLYAVWSPHSYSITYSLNGGSATNPSTYTVETNNFTLANPTKNGYTFKGWTGTGLSSATTTVTIKKGSNGDRSYTATWAPTNYTITYDLAGGKEPGNKTTYTIETADFTLKQPTRDGYKFAGWKLNNTGTAQTTVKITKGSTGNKSYTATWSLETYNLTLDLKGGAIASDYPKTFNINTATFTVPNPSKNGYTFKGWNDPALDPNDTISTLKIEKGSFGNRSFVAVYNVIPYSITYTLNGGKAQNGETLAESYTVEDELGIPNISKSGYTFNGWKEGSSNLYKKDISIAKGTIGNKTYTAGFTPNQYTITYNAGENAVISKTTDLVTFDEAYPSDMPTPTKKGYTFNKWQGITGEKYTTPSNTTLTALYDPNKYTVKFDTNGGSSIADITKDYGDSFTLPSGSREGMAISKWIISKVNGQDVENGTEYNAGALVSNLTDVNNGEVVLSAVWVPTESSVQPNPNPTPSPSPNPDPIKIIDYTEQLKSLQEQLEQLQSLSEMTTAQIQALTSQLNSTYAFSQAQSQALYDLIKTSSLSEAEKVALIRSLAAGNMSDEQKKQLIDLISKSALSDAEKQAYLNTINGISSLSLEQQQAVLKALQAGNASQVALNGVTYEIRKSDNGGLQVAIKGSPGTTISIPDSVTIAGQTYPITEIAPGSFKGNKDVKTVSMGDNVSKIGASAFEGTTGLKSVVLSNNLREIGDKAFKGCSSLGSGLTLPAALQTIGKSAFEGCSKLQTIYMKEPSKLLEIGDKAFFKTGLKSFKLPASVLKIGDQAFANNKALKTFAFAKGSKLITIGKGTWQSDTTLKKISLPKKITKVPANTFKGDKALTSAKMGSEITEIGASTFAGCTKLAKVSIPKKVNTIGKKAFYGDKKLKNVTFKGKVLNKVGAKAFKKCKKNIIFHCPRNKVSSYKKVLKGKY